jgi:hypothetical protein
VVVWVDQLENLFLLPGQLEDNPPMLGAPDVFDVTGYGADPTGRSLATSALQGARRR